MNQPDLFSYGENTYPYAAGYRNFSTSKAAANSINAKTLQNDVLLVLRRHGPLTADEIANKLGIDKLSIRPRCSELCALGKVEDSGLRRVNSSGKKAVVWQLRALGMAV